MTKENDDSQLTAGQKLHKEVLRRSAEIKTKCAEANVITALFEKRHAGTFIPKRWRSWLIKNDRFYFVAADILAQLCYWHRAFKDGSGRWRLHRIVKPSGCKITLTYLANALGHSVFQIRHAIRWLNEEGLIRAEEDRLGQVCCYRIRLLPDPLVSITVKKPPYSSDGAQSSEEAVDDEDE
ncbi:MAG TPA: hypothetical protein VJA21_01295 [Verrucomicrobiae bacterium]